VGWSFQFGRLFGIPLRVHITFFLLLAFVAWSDSRGLQDARAGLIGAAYIAALFACVVLHELGHSLVARRYGVKVSHILLLPIGGVAMMERIPDNPKQEFNIAVAGPLVSIGIGVLCAVALVLTGQPLTMPSGELLTGGSFLLRLGVINIFLALFNLLPAFPMDGGRVLRSLMAQRMDYAKATRLAAGIGQTMAFFFGVVGIFTNPWLLLIALFIYLGAGQEEQQVQVRSLLRNVPVGYAMAKQFAVMQPEEPLARAVQEAMAGYQHDFPVVDGSQLVGLVTRDSLISALYERGAETPLRDVMVAKFCTATSQDSLADLYDRMSRDACPAVVVVQDGQPVGLLTPERVVQYLRYLSEHPYAKNG
jgi:Zn-dependent protease/CBS domain-containing protein